jgi:hypothetical protein
VNRELKYSEDVVRIPASNAEGGACEIIERTTLERAVQPDGSLGPSTVVNRRFDLRTGERVNHLGGDDFELDDGGGRLKAHRQQSHQLP